MRYAKKRGYHTSNILRCQMTITWNSLAQDQKRNLFIICILHESYLLHLFQVKQNWLTWNKPTQMTVRIYLNICALHKSTLTSLFQVNVRNNSIHIRVFAMGKKWVFCSRCAQEKMFFPVFVLATGQKCGFCSVAHKIVSTHRC